MLEALGIEQVGARRPVALFVGEHAFEYEDFLALRMGVTGKHAAGLVAYDGSDLAALGGAHAVQALAQNLAAGAFDPFQWIT
jgi:hypothetical protein